MREFFHHRMWRGSAAIFLILPVVLAVFGPFGTYSDLSFFPRLMYWFILVVCIGTIMWVFNAFALQAEVKWPVSVVARVILAAGCAALPSMAIVLLLHKTMRPSLPEPDTIRMLTLWLEIWVLGSVISLFEHLRQSMMSNTSPATELHGQAQPFADLTPANADAAVSSASVATAAPPQLSRLHRRLPADHQNPVSPIISLSMQDHYVEITTQAGQHLVLMRFSDAIAELDDLQGLRIHRSHWVSTHHMKGLRRAGNRTMLQLSDDRELPVSQTYKAAVQDALSRRLLEREGINAL